MGVVVFTFPVSLFFTLKTTKEYERVVIFRLGRSLGRARGPGLYFVLPCLDRCSVVDLRTRTHSVPRQEVYTLDGVTVHVSAVLTYRVVEARLAVTAVEDCHASTKLLATTVLRSEVGRRNLDRCSVVDLRTRTHSVPRQEVYTLDGVTVHVSAVLFFTLKTT